MRIGIFGGSFNPPHHMHKQIATMLIQQNYVDKVIYVPTGNQYHKKDLLDAKHRLEMLKLMIEGNRDFAVSDYELKNVLTYTYQTLDYFKSIYPSDEIYFICGSDNLKEITTWKNYVSILENYPILVIQRNQDQVEEIIRNIKFGNVVITNIVTGAISSTAIRNHLNCNHMSEIMEQMDENVLEYIEKNKLYQLH